MRGNLLVKVTPVAVYHQLVPHIFVVREVWLPSSKYKQLLQWHSWSARPIVLLNDIRRLIYLRRIQVGLVWFGFRNLEVLRKKCCVSKLAKCWGKSRQYRVLLSWCFFDCAWTVPLPKSSDTARVCGDEFAFLAVEYSCICYQCQEPENTARDESIEI